MDTFHSVEDVFGWCDPHRERIWEEASDADETKLLISRDFKEGTVGLADGAFDAHRTRCDDREVSSRRNEEQAINRAAQCLEPSLQHSVQATPLHNGFPSSFIEVHHDANAETIEMSDYTLVVITSGKSACDQQLFPEAVLRQGHDHR